MEIAIWIVSIFLALFFAAAGFMKAFRPIAEVRKMPWTKGFKDLTIRLIGFSELLGAVGLVAPLATGILVWLSAVAATCLSVLMFGAKKSHIAPCCLHLPIQNAKRFVATSPQPKHIAHRFENALKKPARWRHSHLKLKLDNDS